MNLFTSGLALTGLVTLPLAVQSDTQEAPAPQEARDAFARFRSQEKRPSRDRLRSDASLRVASELRPTRRRSPQDDEVKAKLESEIARLEAEIAALTGKAAALEASDAAVQALKAKKWAQLAESDAVLEASDAALEALSAHDWGKLVQEHTGKLKGLKLDAKDGHQIVTWSGADGQTGYGLFDGDAENVIYFDGQEGSTKKLKEYIAKGLGDVDFEALNEFYVKSDGDGDGEGHSWVFHGDGDTDNVFEWLEGADSDAWAESLEDIAFFAGGDGDAKTLWAELEGDGADFWTEVSKGTHAFGDAEGNVKVLVQGHDGQPAEVHGKVLVTTDPQGDLDEVVRIIDSIKAHSDGKVDVSISTTDDGKVIEKYITRFENGQGTQADSKALYEAIQAVPGQRIHSDVNVLYKDALKALNSAGEPHGGNHQEEIVLFKRALEQAHKSGGQNPFVQRVEVHNHNKSHSEHDDLRDLLEAMAADLTEVRHEVKAIRALLEGGEPLGMAPTPTVPGFPVNTTSAPRTLHLNSASPDEIASLFGVATGVPVPEPAIVGAVTVPGRPIQPIAVGQPIEPIAVGQPIAPIAVGQPIEPIAVGHPIEPIAVGTRVVPGFPAEPKVVSGVRFTPAELPDAPPAPVKVLGLPAGLPKDAPNN